MSEFRLELKAHKRLLTALRETQVDQGKIQVDQGKRLDAVEIKLDALDRKVSEGFSTMNVGMAQIVALLSNAENK